MRRWYPQLVHYSKMNYSDALFFTGKCLTLGCYPDRVDEIRAAIRSGWVEWERVVWVSTAHFVFPALYLQLKRAKLLSDLPSDLVEYMDEFTNLNRQRNQQIIDQAIEITALLNQHDISPIFLKGTAYLLDGLFEDIAERMLVDIDFLVPEKDMLRAAEILINDGYHGRKDDEFYVKKSHFHYPGLIREGKIAGVEIHRWMLDMPYRKYFNYEYINDDKKKLELPVRAYVFSDSHQIINNIMVVQINDHGFWQGKIYLRQMYDLLLLSQKKDPIMLVKEFGHYFHRLNAYLAISTKIFANPPCISYEPTWQSRLYLRRIRTDINYPKFARYYKFVFKMIRQIFYYINVLFQTTYRKDFRQFIFKKLRNPSWYGEHIRKLL